MSLPGVSEINGINAFLVSLLGTDATLQAAIVAEWAQEQLPAVSPVPDAPAYRWLHSKLAPQGTPYPVVIYSCQTAPDIRGVGLQRIATTPTYLVKVIGKTGSASDLAAIQGRIDALLEGFQPTLSLGVMVGSARRNSSLELPEVYNNVRYTHLGGMYQFFTWVPGD